MLCSMESLPQPIPRTVEEVFSDFKGRRAGLIKALTTGSLKLHLFMIFFLSFEFFVLVFSGFFFLICVFLFLQMLKSFISSVILVGNLNI